MNSSTISAPIWPDFSVNSEKAVALRQVKQGNPADYWKIMRSIFLHDFHTLPKERMKVWASVWSVPFQNHGIHPYFTEPAINAIMQGGHDAELYRDAIKEPMVGCTKEDFEDVITKVPELSATMTRVGYLSHLIRCGYTPEKLRNMKTIVELGGGLGDMADIIYKLGFTGNYVIFDLPEVSFLQRWYHEQLGRKDITYVPYPEELCPADLCIATWSFTEMPLYLREEILTYMDGTKNWLIAYSNKIFDLDNRAYIHDVFLPRFKNHDVRDWKIPLIEYFDSEHYLTVMERTPVKV